VRTTILMLEVLVLMMNMAISLLLMEALMEKEK
jgi:hypothetical protein